MADDPLTFLEKQGAQRDVIDGLRGRAADWRTLWDTCPRGDWLLAIAVRLGIDHPALVRAAARCARTTLRFAVGEESENVLDVAESWSRGGASAEDVAEVTLTLEATSAIPTDLVSAAAARAALAVGLGVGDPEVLPAAPAAAAEATMSASLDCGFELAMRFSHAECADAVRACIPWEAVALRAGVPAE